MSFLTDLFSSGASTLVDSVSGVLKNVVTTTGEKMTLDNEMRKAELDYQLEEDKIGVQKTEIHLKDVSSARDMNTAIETSDKASWLSKNIPPVLSIITTLLTFTLFYILVFKSEIISPDKKDVVIYILGVLSGILGQVFGFYFGSSKGSDDKNTTIKNLSA